MKKLERVTAPILILFTILALVSCSTTFQDQQVTRIIITAHKIPLIKLAEVKPREDWVSINYMSKF